MATAADVSRLLKLEHELTDFSGFVPLVRDGFSRQCFNEFLSKTNIAKPVLQLSSFEALIDGESQLSSEASDCLLRIARVYAEALDLFGEETDVVRWMTTSSLTLGDQTPLELLDTTVGFEIVLQEVKRVQYGIAG